MDFATGSDFFLEVARASAVDEKDHVLAQIGLVVEDVVAQARVGFENARQRGAHGPPVNIVLGTGNEALQMRGKDDVRHAQGMIPGSSE
jgi:hypothetical protein